MHVSDEDLDRYLLERLDATAVSTVESHFHQCAACVIRLVSSPLLLQRGVRSIPDTDAPPGPEKRHEPRIATTGAGVLQRINPLSSERLEVRILDVSTEGIRIGSPHSFDPGTLVKVRFQGKVAFGEIRHCRMIHGTYHAGIHLRNGFHS